MKVINFNSLPDGHTHIQPQTQKGQKGDKELTIITQLFLLAHSCI